MLRITSNSSPSGATKYFDEGLAKSDYYSKDDGKETVGRWGGKASERLGLSGEIDKQDFEKLAHNTNPSTDEKLNPRHKDNSKVGYDFTFSAPKSASVAYAINGDNRIKDAFQSSVSETMNELESDMMKQEGQGKNKRHERTGNMVWGEFTHKTSRPVGGKADPHLHTHAFAFNTTYNEDKGRFQAGEFGNIKKNAPYYEAAFDARFAKKMQGLGYDIEKRGHSWEIKNIDKGINDKFSNRTKQIEAEANKRGLKTDKLKSELGAKTRSSKRQGESYKDLQAEWKSRLSKDELNKIQGLGKNGSFAVEKKKQGMEAKNAVDYSINHTFERKSAESEKNLWKNALKQGYGSVTPEQVKKEFANRDVIKSEIKNNNYITTKDALRQEQQLIQNVRNGRGKASSINANYKPKADYLNKEQKNAISHVLSSRDNVMVVEGGAGTGKTTLMKEVRDGAKQRGKKVFGFAPSASASRGVLRDEGFKNADTISKFLNDKELQNQTKGQIIWIDEAGMVGNKTMNKVFDVANKNNSRVLLTGDTKQHNSVEAGDALRTIKEKGGIKVANVNTIQRQRNAQQYKQAVKSISDGNVGKGFDRLDKMGNVKEITNKQERHQAIAKDYLQSKNTKRSALVVAPTHKEGGEVTNAIRDNLKQHGHLDKKEKSFTRQKSLNYTDAQKQDGNNYKKDMAVQFHQNAKGFKAGDKYDVSKVENGGVFVKNNKGKEQALNLSDSKRFNVYEKKQVNYAKGDKLRITQNGKSMEGKRLNNGNIYTIKGFDKGGNIKLDNNSTISKDFRNHNHGYVVTSHASQGKTVDNVMIAQSADSYKASNNKQFYVSVSRGKQSAKIYTDNKQELRNNVQKSGDRMAASDVAKNTRSQQQSVARGNYQKQNSQAPPPPTKTISHAKG